MEAFDAAQFLEELRQLGIDVALRDGKLRVAAPAGVLDARTRERLAEHKPALMACLSTRTLSPAVEAGPAQRGPQTHAQQGMWLIDHFNPGNIAYNIPQAWEAQGTLDPEILQQAIDRLLARHATLRTRFFEEENEFLQQLDPQARAALEVTDLSAAGQNADTELERRMTEQARRPLPLDQAPLIRFHLFRLPQGRDVVFYNIHHIIADARSLEILRAELTILYKQVYGLDEPALPPLPMQYIDFAAWAAANWTAAALPAQAAYWKAQLKGAPQSLDLPGAGEYPARRSAQGSFVLLSLDRECAGRLTAIAREEGATLFMVLLSAFAVTLEALSGSTDISIGTPFTQRTYPGTESLIGLFINMLVLRLQTGGSADFREIVRRTRRTALDAYDNSDLPFQEVVRLLKPDPRSRRTPLFQVMFQFDAAAGATRETLLQLATNPGTARYDLTLQLNEHESGISGFIEYATDIFGRAAAESIANQYVAVTRAVAAAPDTPLGEVLRATPSAFASRESVSAPAAAPEQPADGDRPAGIFSKLRRLAGRRRTGDPSSGNR